MVLNRFDLPYLHPNMDKQVRIAVLSTSTKVRVGVRGPSYDSKRLGLALRGRQERHKWTRIAISVNGSQSTETNVV